MPSTRPKAFHDLPRHWQDALRFLAIATPGSTILLEAALPPTQLHTAHAKARAIRQAVQEFPDYPAAVRELVASGRLRFRRDGPFASNLTAYTTFTSRPLKEILDEILTAQPPGMAD